MDKFTKFEDFDIHIMPAPSLCIVPLKVTDSHSAEPIVNLKQIVRKGEQIARASDENGVDIFSPVYGRVVGFDMFPLSDRVRAYCVFIENLDNDKKVTNDAILNAKFDAMKKSLATQSNRFAFDKAKLDENTQTDAQNTDELDAQNANFDSNTAKNESYTDIFGSNTAENVDEADIKSRQEYLNTMLNSTNAVVDFNYDDIKNKNEKENEKPNIASYDGREDVVCTDKDFRFVEYDYKGDILAHLNKCGVITQNGKKLGAELADDKIIIVPCFDAYDYAYENSTVLVKHFESIYKALETICEKLNRIAIFLFRNGDELPDIASVWGGERKGGISKLQVKQTSARKILKKHFDIIDITEPQLDFGALNNHFLVLSPVCLYNAYKALAQGLPQISTYMTIGGRGLQRGGVYEVPSGCTLEHIQTVLGGTHSEQDIEDDKSDALEAVGEYYEARDAYKNEQDVDKKKELKLVMKNKKKLADKLVVNYIRTVKRKINSCLGQIVFDDIANGQTHGNFQAVLELKNRRVYYLAVNQC